MERAAQCDERKRGALVLDAAAVRRPARRLVDPVHGALRDLRAPARVAQLRRRGGLGLGALFATRRRDRELCAQPVVWLCSCSSRRVLAGRRSSAEGRAQAEGTRTPDCSCLRARVRRQRRDCRRWHHFPSGPLARHWNHLGAHSAAAEANGLRPERGLWFRAAAGAHVAGQQPPQRALLRLRHDAAEDAAVRAAREPEQREERRRRAREARDAQDEAALESLQAASRRPKCSRLGLVRCVVLRRRGAQRRSRRRVGRVEPEPPLGAAKQRRGVRNRRLTVALPEYIPTYEYNTRFISFFYNSCIF